MGIYELKRGIAKPTITACLTAKALGRGVLSISGSSSNKNGSTYARQGTEATNPRQSEGSTNAKP